VSAVRPSATIEVWATTDPGLARARNEDCIGSSGWAGQGTIGLARHSYSGVEPVVCVVADGLGGLPAGDVASLTVTRELVHGPAPADTAALDEALLAAHRLLRDHGAADPALAGMATTVAVLVIAAETILCANVGDTRIYELGGGAVEPVSFDDTPGLAAGSGELRTSVLTQALGGTKADPPRPHVQWFKREPLGFLLCSDGLTNTVSEAEIGATLAAGEDAAVLRALLGLALDRGAPDNVSVMLVRT